MFETEADDDLTIPDFDERAIQRFGEFVKDQMRHMYRMGKLQAKKEADDQRKLERMKYGR